MSTDLRERLELLAARAPEPAAPGETADLWRRGRARHLRRTAAGVAATLVIALVAGVGLSTLWSRIPDARPTGDTAKLVLPDRFFVPSPWLPGTDDKGPIGPLAAVVESDRRGWFGSGEALAGVSAASGEYRFLDLPDRAEIDGAAAPPLRAALSSDGRLLAYWSLGQPQGDPIGQPDGEPSIVGVTVYDTVGGSLEKVPIPTEHGLSPQGLAWAGDTLFFKAGQYQQGVFGAESSVRVEGTWHWRPSRQPVRDDTTDRLRIEGAAPDGYMSSGRRGYLVVHEDGTRSVVAPERSFTSTPVLSPDGRLAVGISDPTPNGDNGLADPVAVVDTSTHQRHLIPGAMAFEVLGWRDAAHIVIATAAANRQQLEISAVDIGTGDTTPLSVRPWNDGLPFVAASDVWSAAVSHVDQPPSPMDPRLRALWWTLGIAVVVGLVVLLRRRRVRP